VYEHRRYGLASRPAYLKQGAQIPTVNASARIDGEDLESQ